MSINTSGTAFAGRLALTLDRAGQGDVTFSQRNGHRVATVSGRMNVKMVVGPDTTAAEFTADLLDLRDAVGDGVKVLGFDTPPLVAMAGRTWVPDVQGGSRPVPAMPAARTILAYRRPSGIEAGLVVRRLADGLEVREYEARPEISLFAPMATRTFIPDDGGIDARSSRDPLRAAPALLRAMLGHDRANDIGAANRDAMLTRDADILIALLDTLSATVD